MKRRAHGFWGVLWLLGVTALVYSLAAYSAEPGAVGAAPGDWPADTTLRHRGRPTLVMLAHPRCPCTRASMAELERLMSEVDGVDAYVLMMVPTGVDDPEAFRSGLLWDMARDIPHVTVMEDPGGREAERFGAETSGHVVLYDASAALRFSGGITPGRGHEGASHGHEAIKAWVRDASPREKSSADSSSSVFGCPLRSPDRLPALDRSDAGLRQVERPRVQSPEQRGE